jgi:hypothetical protein
MATYTFHRADRFYVIDLVDDDDARQNAECNPGTLKVIRWSPDKVLNDKIVWEASKANATAQD